MKRIISCFLLLSMLLGMKVSAAETLSANVTMNIPKSGHIYFTGESSNIDIGYFNNSAEAMDLSVDIEMLGRKYGKTWSYTKKLSLTAYAGEEETLNFCPGDELGVYDIYDITITLSDGNLTKVITNELSYVKRGVRNDKFGVNTHFLYIDYNKYVDKGTELAAKAGVGLMRDNLEWASYEKSAGVYKLTDDFDNILNKMCANDIEPLLVLLYGNTLYTGTTSHIPSNDAQCTAFCDYAKQFVADTKDRVKYYEIWNEPNTSGGSFNDGDDGTNYGNLVKAVYPVIKAEYPDSYVMGYSATGLNSMTDKAAATGAYNYMDAASFHPYPYYSKGELPEASNKYIPRFVTRSKKSNVPVSVSLFRPGKCNFSEEETLTDTYAYLDVVTTLTDGVFKFDFSPVYGEGVYLLKLTAKNGEVIEKYLDLRSKLTATIDIGSKQLSDIAANKAFKCNVTVSAENEITKTYDVYLALYENGKLMNVMTAKNELMNAETEHTTTFKVQENYKISKIRAFAWEKGVMPVTEDAELE